MSWIEEAKRRAAEAAAAHVVDDSVIGLGSGSTAKHFIEAIGSHLQSGKLRNVIGVPTSFQAASEAVSAGIPLTTLDEHPELDLAVDGADQIDGMLHAIKGGGGALLREKVIASASVEYILIADERKFTQRLGDGCPLPIEVLPFSLGTVLRKVEKIGAEAVVRTGKGKLGPVVTDNGNFIIDANFGHIVDPPGLERGLKAVPGVLETGLFLDITTLAYLGTHEGVKEMHGSP